MSRTLSKVITWLLIAEIWWDSAMLLYLATIRDGCELAFIYALAASVLLLLVDLPEDI
ncbi:hypothetical protein FACS189443_2960 [Planctomycetales bacterium]|nr:hypothetical protein FACS189443_2960 [Planctomycetales bacterium]